MNEKFTSNETPIHRGEVASPPLWLSLQKYIMSTLLPTFLSCSLFSAVYVRGERENILL